MSSVMAICELYVLCVLRVMDSATASLMCAVEHVRCVRMATSIWTKTTTSGARVSFFLDWKFYST